MAFSHITAVQSYCFFFTYAIVYAKKNTKEPVFALKKTLQTRESIHIFMRPPCIHLAYLCVCFAHTSLCITDMQNIIVPLSLISSLLGQMVKRFGQMVNKKFSSNGTSLRDLWVNFCKISLIFAVFVIFFAQNDQKEGFCVIFLPKYLLIWKKSSNFAPHL